MRLMKVLAFSNDRVLEIIGGVLRAMSQMYLILTLMVINPLNQAVILLSYLILDHQFDAIFPAFQHYVQRKNELRLR